MNIQLGYPTEFASLLMGGIENARLMLSAFFQVVPFGYVLYALVGGMILITIVRRWVG